MIHLASADGRSSASINPVGAALSELWFDGVQIAGAPDIYSGVTLFPWPNRIFGATWIWNDNQMALPLNDAEQNASLHGLVYAERFDWVQREPTQAELSLDFAATNGYPFEALLQVTYRITERTLEVTQRVTNEGSVTMPFAIGFHPYFVADSNSVFETGQQKKVLAEHHLDETLGPNALPARLKTDRYDLQVSSEDVPYLHVFTNRYSTPGQIWFAMEPQTSPADSLNSGIGLTKLPAGTSKSFTYQLNW